MVLSMSACLSWSDMVRVMGWNQCLPLRAHAQTRPRHVDALDKTAPPISLICRIDQLSGNISAIRDPVKGVIDDLGNVIRRPQQFRKIAVAGVLIAIPAAAVSVPAYAAPGFGGTPNTPAVLPAPPPADPPTDAPQPPPPPAHRRLVSTTTQMTQMTGGHTLALAVSECPKGLG